MTSEQTCAVLSTLIVNAKWTERDFSPLQRRIKDDPQGVGREFDKFLDAAMIMPQGDMKVVTAPFDFKSLLGQKWKLLTTEQDARSQELTEVDFARVDFIHCLTEEEVKNGNTITGEEKFLRLKSDKERGRIRYGASVCWGLYLNYKARGKGSVLERLYREKGVTYMDFFGDILEGLSGDRYVLFLCRDGFGQWRWNYHWLVYDWCAKLLSVVSPQVS